LREGHLTRKQQNEDRQEQLSEKRITISVHCSKRFSINKSFFRAYRLA
jgi:hypothetical protein